MSSSGLAISRGRGMLRCLLVLFILSVGIGVAVYACFMHFGAPTAFSLGDSRKGFTDSPNMRGTFNIVTACFATILTCVYRALHLDVQYAQKGEGEGGVERDEKNVARKLWIQMKSMKHRAVWVVFNIVAPELVAYVAVIEWSSARGYRNRLFGDVYGYGPPIVYSIHIVDQWTLAHEHMADMGGFKVPVEGGGYVILRSGYDFHEWARFNPEAFKSIDLKQVGIDIEGHSKADGLLKAYTVIQASWLVVQTIERVCKGLSVTELEVTTCAYVVCAIFTYACWWDKPYGVQKHILLHVPPTPRPHWRQNTDPTPFNRSFYMSGDTASSLELPAVVLSAIMGAVVGAIHCTLWNVQFINTNGQLLWRVCCITQIVAPILMSVSLAIPGLKGRDKWNNIALLPALIPCFLQFCARIVIFILIGYSFWSQPADVYRVADWSWSWFPHIS